jgi:hypothetical protein
MLIEELRVGDQVCRMGADDWEHGTVTKIDPPMVAVDFYNGDGAGWVHPSELAMHRKGPGHKSMFEEDDE